MPTSPTLDGSVQGNVGSNTACVVNLTTSLTDDFIYVAVSCNGGPVVSVSGGGLTWSRRKQNANAQFNFETWRAFSPLALTAEAITVTQTSTDFMSVVAFGVNGATGFDSNAALPDSIGDGSGAVITDRMEITTDSPDDFLIGAYRFGHASAPQPGTGWTSIESGNFMAVQYKVVSAPQSALDVVLFTGFNGGNDDQNGGVADALTANAPPAAPTGTWDSTEPPDTFSATNLTPTGTWASTEAADVFAAVGDSWGLDGHATGGVTGASATSATVVLTTTYPDDVIVVCVNTGGNFNRGHVTSIADDAGLTWKRRHARKTYGVTPSVEEWWAHAPAALSGDTITVNTTTTGAIDLIAFGVHGANFTTPWDIHTQAGWFVDNYGANNPNAPVRTSAADTFDFAFYASRDVDSAHTVSTPYTFLDFSSNGETGGYNLRSGLAYNSATGPQNTHVSFGQTGGGANSRTIMTDAIVKAGQIGTSDEIRWHFDGYMPFGPGVMVLSGSVTSAERELLTFETDEVIVCAILTESSISAPEVSSVSDTSGGTSPWLRRSRVTNNLGTIALEIWYAWANNTFASAPITVTCATGGPGDVISFTAVGINGPSLLDIWDGDNSLPAVNHGDSPPDTYQSVAGINTINQNCLVLCFGANADVNPNGFNIAPFLQSDNVAPGFGIAGPTPVNSSAPGANIATEFYFQHDQLAAVTAEFDTSPKSISWLMIADALPVGPPTPPTGTWVSTEGLDVVNAAGYVPAFATWASVETPDSFSGAPAQAPYLSFGWLGWVPAFATWASTEAKDHLSGAAWVIGQPITGTWHSVEDKDRMAASNWATVTGVWASHETLDNWPSAGFLLPTAAPTPPTRKRRLMVIN